MPPDLHIDKSKSTILIADSCYCGISAMPSILRTVRDKNVIFLADYRFNPFGLKSQGMIASLVKEWENHFLPYNLEHIYIACNTASIAHRNENRAPFSVPVDDMISALNRASSARQLSSKTVSVFGTKLTIESNAYQNILSKETGLPVSGVVGTYCERDAAGMEERLSAQAIEEIKSIPQTDVLFLACTCFVYLHEEIARHFCGKVIDISAYLSPQLQIEENADVKGNNIILLSSKAAKLPLLEQACKRIVQESFHAQFYDWDRGFSE